jgi:hypothetical protein
LITFKKDSSICMMKIAKVKKGYKESINNEKPLRKGLL